MKKLVLILSLILAIGGGWRASQTVHAQVPLPAVKSFTIVPPTTELEVAPGETKTFTMKAINHGEAPLALQVKIFDFIVLDEKGTPYLISRELEDLAPATLKRYAASKWVSPNTKEFVLKPREIRDFQVVIVVPEDALPGGHYAAVVLEPTLGIVPLQEQEAVASGTQISAQLASLLSVRVKGPVKEDALVKQFTAPRFSEYGPITFKTEITNLSDSHIRPQGTITVKNLLGREVTSFKLEERNIFPKATFAYTNTWETKYLAGRYRADLLAIYGTSGKVLLATIYFYVFPVRMALAVVLGMAIVILSIILYKRYKRGKQLQEESTEEMASAPEEE